MTTLNITSAQHHPVWEVYDCQRTMLLNVKYYSHRLHGVERQSLWMEVLLAITAPGSAVAAFWLKEVPFAEGAWKFLMGLAALIAIVKPFLKHAQRIKKYERVLVEYRAILSDIEEVVYQIKLEQEYSKNASKNFEKIFKKKRNLLQMSPDVLRNRQLVEACMTEVNEEIPNHSLYIPEK